MTQWLLRADAPGFGALRWTPARLALTLVVLGAIGYSLSRLSDGQQLLAAASGLWARPELVAFFVVSYTAAFYVRAGAWQLLLGAGPGINRLFAALQIGLFVNHAFPTKAGELVRIYLLTRHGVPVGPAAASTALSRLLDFAAVCGIAVVFGGLAGSRPDLLLGQLALPIGAVSLAGALCWLLARRRGQWLSARLPGKLATLVRGVQEGLAEVRPARLALAFALVVPSWLLEAGAVWSVAQAAGVELAWQVAVAATAFTIAFQGFQFTPGGIGVYEASLTAVLALFGVDPATGLALAIATHALKFIYSYVAGFLCLLPEGLMAGSPGPPSTGVGTAQGARPAAWPPKWAGRPQVAVLARASSTRAAASLKARQWGDANLALAGLAVAAGALFGWLSASPLALLIGLALAAPLVVLGRCHHLPVRLQPALLVVPAALALLAGVPSPATAAVALGGAIVTAGLARRASLPAVVWPALLTQAILWSAAQPVAGFAFSLAAALGMLLFRQWVLGRQPLPPPGPVPAGSTIAVLIPVRNEAPAIGGVVAHVPRAALRERGYQTCVIVVDDGSTDRSAAIAAEAGADLIVRHPTGRGLGAAVRTALATARARGAAAAVYLDGDGEYASHDIPAVLGPVLAGEADYVLGNRFPHARRVMRFSRWWGNRAFTLGMCLLTGRRLRDAQTGFRAFSARALAAAEIIHDYNYAQVLTLDLLRKRLRLAQVEIHYRARAQGTSFIRYRTYARRVLPAIARELLAP